MNALNNYQRESKWNSLSFVILLIAVLLIWFKPEHEKLAWRLTIVGWLMVVLMYVGHVSTSILGVLNL